MRRDRCNFKLYKEVDNNKCENEKIGSSSHTDWGFLTLVLQSDDSQ
ncbi:18934_t:CDS:1, partial [Funneliformis geosporum]